MNYFYQSLLEFGEKLFQQLYFVFFSTIIASAIGVLSGIVLVRYPRIIAWAMGMASALWTIPSLALLALLVPLFGVGITPAIIALTFYGILPVLRNILIGLQEVPHSLIETADSLGFTPIQRLWRVELPLASPTIIAGIRIATSVSVGIATLAAFVGAGGLGDFINRGLALNNTRLILLGAVPAAVMALSLDFLIGAIESAWRSKRLRKPRIFILAAMLLVCMMAGNIFLSENFKPNSTIRIASKNFTEQLILSEMMGQLIEAKTSLKVQRKWGLGTTELLHRALMAGEIDIYPEYTGTAYLTVLKKTESISAKEIYQQVKAEYLQRYKLLWLNPFGFNNSQALVVGNELSQRYHLYKISDILAVENKFIIGAPAEFTWRPDGMPGLQKKYNLRFAHIQEMDKGLLYKALAQHEVDIIMAASTDGRLYAQSFVILKDDKHFFPSYLAAPIVRLAILKKHPKIYDTLQLISGSIDAVTMQQLNYAVEMKNRTPQEVAREFLLKKKLINH